MMPSVNRVIAIGNLGKEPDTRVAPDGRLVTSFKIPTMGLYTTSDGERQEQAEWFMVVTWGKLAEQCSGFLKKGQLVYVEGRLRSRRWEDQDGQKHLRNDIIASRVTFLNRAVAFSVEGRGDGRLTQMKPRPARM